MLCVQQANVRVSQVVPALKQDTVEKLKIILLESIQRGKNSYTINSRLVPSQMVQQGVALQATMASLFSSWQVYSFHNVMSKEAFFNKVFGLQLHHYQTLTCGQIAVKIFFGKGNCLTDEQLEELDPCCIHVSVLELLKVFYRIEQDWLTHKVPGNNNFNECNIPLHLRWEYAQYVLRMLAMFGHRLKWCVESLND